MPLAKQKFDNRIVRKLDIDQVDDAWSSPFQGKSKYKPTEIPSVIVP